MPWVGIDACVGPQLGLCAKDMVQLPLLALWGLSGQLSGQLLLWVEFQTYSVELAGPPRGEAWLCDDMKGVASPHLVVQVDYTPNILLGALLHMFRHRF